ncbi:MAG: hypothetical protein IPH20_16555 [Bacteroidales bacterium]|nr:hypothetical protein [Bacteroidales bacterium]
MANIAEALPYHREMGWTITRSPNLFDRKTSVNLSDQPWIPFKPKITRP